MEKRQITDLAGVKNLERSLKKGSLQPGHTAFHRRGQSSATECLDKPALPPIKIPIDTKKVLPPPFVSAVSASAKTEVKGRVKSSAEFVERYQLARKEESARSRERARSVRGSLERVRGRGSVRSVVGRAKKNAAAAESAKASATSTQAPTPTGEAGETVVEETGKEKLRRELRGIFERR